MRFPLLFIIAFFAAGCTLKKDVELRAIENIELTPGDGKNPLLKAEALFYNPNQVRMKVKEIKLDIFIDGKKSASVDQQLKSVIKSKAEFTLPIEVKLSLKDIGLVDAVLGFLGGKKYQLHYVGHIKASVKGFPVRIPVDYTREVKLRL